MQSRRKHGPILGCQKVSPLKPQGEVTTVSRLLHLYGCSVMLMVRPSDLKGFCVAGFQAYTSQIAAMTMMALALGEDTISSRNRREDIIDDLFDLPGTSLPSFTLNC